MTRPEVASGRARLRVQRVQSALLPAKNRYGVRRVHRIVPVKDAYDAAALAFRGRFRPFCNQR